MAHPAGLPPANSPFEAEDDCNFTTDALSAEFGARSAEWKQPTATVIPHSALEMVGRHGAAPCSAV